MTAGLHCCCPYSEAGGEAVEPAVEGTEDPLVVPHGDEAGDAVEDGHA